jgi:hypothetical protein
MALEQIIYVTFQAVSSWNLPTRRGNSSSVCGKIILPAIILILHPGMHLQIFSLLIARLFLFNARRASLLEGRNSIRDLSRMKWYRYRFLNPLSFFETELAERLQKCRSKVSFIKSIPLLHGHSCWTIFYSFQSYCHNLWPTVNHNVTSSARRFVGL